MENFIVSARKYRPQLFNTVIGQEHITTTLKNAINSNQLAHAFLFCGPRGVGKTTCARILAKTINCENRTKEGEACNTCNSCTSFDNGTSMNIHELDAASNNSVEDIRTLVDQVRFAPQAGKYKVYIIDEVHMLTSSAFNAFLKTLEEPPHYAIFILATTEKHKILPTILSRCQIFDFKRITLTDTVSHLQEICKSEKIKAEKSALHLIAQKSEGCMRDSLSMLDKIVSFTGGDLTYAHTLEHLNVLDEDYYFKLLDLMQSQQLASTLLLFDEINSKGFEGDILLEGFAEFIRNLLVSKDKKSAVLLEVAEDFKARYIEKAPQISTGWLIAALNILNESAINYKMSRNRKLHMEMLLIKLNYLNQAVEILASGGAVQSVPTANKTKAVSFRALTISAVKKKEQQPIPVTQKDSVAAKLILEEPLPNHEKSQVQNPLITETEKQAPKLSSLSKIRQEMIEKNNQKVDPALPLTLESLTLAWKTYTQKLEKLKNHTAVSNFNMSVLSIEDENNFKVTCKSQLGSKFIEVEKISLSEFLRKELKNRSIQFSIQLDEGIDNNQPVSTPVLNSKEQFKLLTEINPLIKTLKDNLKLDLDY